MSDVSTAFLEMAGDDFEWIRDQEFQETVTHTAKSDGTETEVPAIVERFPDEYEVRDSGRVVLRRRTVHLSKRDLATVDPLDAFEVDDETYGVESLLNEQDFIGWEIRLVREVRTHLQATAGTRRVLR